MAASETLKVGNTAPDFTLPAQNGTMVSLKQMLGDKAVVLFFYPKDYTTGCTAEACSFRDNYEVFKEAGAEVVGISDDSVESHQGFAAKHRLPYTLLSDTGGKVRKLYGVATTMGFIKGRVTFVLDRNGIIRHIFNSQTRFDLHVAEALRIIKELQSQPATT